MMVTNHVNLVYEKPVTFSLKELTKTSYSDQIIVASLFSSKDTPQLKIKIKLILAMRVEVYFYKTLISGNTDFFLCVCVYLTVWEINPKLSWFSCRPSCRLRWSMNRVTEVVRDSLPNMRKWVYIFCMPTLPKKYLKRVSWDSDEINKASFFLSKKADLTLWVWVVSRGEIKLFFFVNINYKK